MELDISFLYQLGFRALMANILEEVLKLDLQTCINSMWLPDSFTESSALHMLFTNSKMSRDTFYQIKFTLLLKSFYIL